MSGDMTANSYLRRKHTKPGGSPWAMYGALLVDRGQQDLPVGVPRHQALGSLF